MGAHQGTCNRVDEHQEVTGNRAYDVAAVMAQAPHWQGVMTPRGAPVTGQMSTRS